VPAHHQFVDLEPPDARASYCEPADRQRAEHERTQREGAEGQRAGGDYRPSPYFGFAALCCRPAFRISAQTPARG
jgi:hypothetical protein